jgi:DNA-binding FadR family transcriptional regulator
LKKVDISSAARSAAQMLREECLQQPEGSHLGSEDELVRRLGVSKPTLRQAARLLEHEQLIVIRRGTHGGFYVRRPDVDTVVHTAAIYLHTRSATMRNMLDASLALMTETIRSAVKCEDEGLRNRLAGIARDAADGAGLQRRAMIRSDAEFGEVLGLMTGNPVIQLFVSIIWDFGLGQTGMSIGGRDPAWVREWSLIKARLALAVLDRNENEALAALRKRTDLLTRWFESGLNLPVDAPEER